MIRRLYVSYVINTAALSAIIVLVCIAVGMAINDRDWSMVPVVFMAGFVMALLFAILVGGAAGLIGWPIFQRVYHRTKARGRSDVSAAILAAYSVLAVAAFISVALLSSTDGLGAITIFGLLPAAALTPMMIRGLWTPVPVTEGLEP